MQEGGFKLSEADPCMLYKEDEKGVCAIWLANNSSVSERTKHVDLRAHFVRDMIKDQVIEINFVKSAENDSDIMTKNQQGQHYMYAKSKLVYTVQEMNEKSDIQDEETVRMLES